MTVRRGEIRGIVGESGCGKSMTAMSILQLVDKPGKIVSGEVCFKGENLLTKSRREMTAVRGKQIAVIFQEPKSSLNPVLRVGNQLLEVLRVHQDAGRPAKESEGGEYAERGRHPRPDAARQQLSARDVGRHGAARHDRHGDGAARPDLLIADEPTTALDVTIQAQVLDLIRQLARRPADGGDAHHA